MESTFLLIHFILNATLSISIIISTRTRIKLCF